MLFLELLLLFVVYGDVKGNITDPAFEPTIAMIHTKEIEVTQEELEEVRRINDSRTHRIMVATQFINIVEREAEAMPVDEVEGEYVMPNNTLPDDK